MPHVTQELVAKAYGALATGDKEKIRQYWADELVWQVPGHNQVSGWKFTLDEFIAFMAKVGNLSAGSFNMQTITIMVNDEYSCDITNNKGHRAGDDNKKLDIDVAHVLRWRDGKVIGGRGAIMGDGTARYDDFWTGSTDAASRGTRESVKKAVAQWGGVTS